MLSFLHVLCMIRESLPLGQYASWGEHLLSVRAKGPVPISADVLCSVVFVCNRMDCSPPGSSVHGILQARILEWVAMSSSRGSSQPRDRAQVSHTAGRFFTVRATREEEWPTAEAKVGRRSPGWNLEMNTCVFQSTAALVADIN